MHTQFSVDHESISAVDVLIRPYLRRTPVLDLDGVVLKLESLQHAGSFKTRGALSNLLTREVPAIGVVAASGGNHGAAVASAAQRLNIRARIFVPTVSSPAKIARIRECGAELTVAGDSYADALELSDEYARSSGALPVHAFGSPETINGAGTIAKEFEEQAAFDTVLVPVGGGGLIAGVAAWFAGRVRVIGVEPEGAPTMHHAFAAGAPVDAPVGSVAKDSLAPRRVGELNYRLAKQFVERVVLVSDEAIVAAQRDLWDRARVVVEPGGAAAYSALYGGAYKPQPGERVAAIVSGGNTVISWT
jgi:threonine dehydratase